mmetsp:Transcript_11872/g.27750  ORF Transcript_11872/g.27750 Transcript_11872/m.27750 type:complete len:492 (+) Transcript_11872:126-1601(+)
MIRRSSSFPADRPEGPGRTPESTESSHRRTANTDGIDPIPEFDVEDENSSTERSNHNDETETYPPLTGSFVTVNPSTEPRSSSRRNNRTKMSFIGSIWAQASGYMNSTRLMVLMVLCLQNSMFTILRRYSQGVLQETYSKHELLLLAEVIKILYSSWMISKNLAASGLSMGDDNGGDGGLIRRKSLSNELVYLVSTSRKMFVLALIYGAMNILSFISLRNISAGIFTIFAQCKILTTATFSTIMLKRQYSWTKWRALIALMLGVLLFSEPIWGNKSDLSTSTKNGNVVLGTAAVLIEITLSGFASIYFEKVIKTDPLQLGIWERNFQLALGSVPVYILFIVGNGGGTAGFLGGWSWLAFLLAGLGAAGGLLVALSIKYGDSILKTLATTGAIVLTGLLDHFLLGGPLTPSMMIAGVQVIIAICNYTFDASPNPASSNASTSSGSPSKSLKPSLSSSLATNSIPSGADDERLEKNASRGTSNEETQSLINKA